MTAPLIRPATRADFADIAVLQAASWRTAYRSFLPPSYLRDRLDADLVETWHQCRLGNRDVVLVAEDEKSGDLRGFISVWCRQEPYIDNLHCAPEHTSNGIGRALMKQAFKKLVAQRKKSAYLSVLVGNDRARRFYLRLGGQPEAIRQEALFGYSVKVEYMHWSNLAVYTSW